MCTLGSTVHLIPTKPPMHAASSSAYAKTPEQVEWNDVQDALASALAAFDLPEWFLDVPMIDGDRGPNPDCED